MFHEIRKLSRNIDDAGKFIQKTIIHSDDENVSNLIDDILQTINMIMIRVNSYELLKNPGAITSAKQPNIQVYKKFDKSRYIFMQYCRTRDININFVNECYFTIQGYEIFDILPYILLDNAVKYSPNKHNISVFFDTNQKTVVINNWGPSLIDDEISFIQKRGFRGKNAKTYPGSGLGLDVARQICELHNIKLFFFTEESEVMISGVQFKQFKVELRF